MSNARQMIGGLLLIALFIPVAVQSQTQNGADEVRSMDIEQCYEWANENYPLLRQIDIIEKTTAYNLSNAAKGNLPQVNVNGQATYQSEVTQLPIELPNVDIPTLSKDQYKIYGEVYQPLSNFGQVSAQRKLAKTNGDIAKQQVEVGLFQLRNQINQVFFGTLLIDEKITQLKLIQSDLDSALARTEAAVTNGTATLVDKRLLQVERISLEQQVEENRANQGAFVQMLSLLTGKNITVNTQLLVPKPLALNTNINRPELQIFGLQKQAIHLQEKQLNNGLLPNIGLFGQVGYGRPGLNFLNPEFASYYIGGLKFNWHLSRLYTHGNKKKSLQLAVEKLSTQQDIFLLNTRIIQSRQSSEIDKYEGLVQSDREIISIREEILVAAKVQLNNGLITTIDYVRLLNDVSKARQMLLLHETQLLLAQHNLKITSGN